MRTAIAILAAVMVSAVSVGASATSMLQSDEGYASTPVSEAASGSEPAHFVLVERAASITNLDLGDPGPSAGDMIVWGPNALYDETDTTDTGATTQGFCVYLDASSLCLLTESILFEDGSMLQLQGIQAAGAGASTRFLVGGSGQYLGATGIVSVHPSDDLTTWIKTFEVNVGAAGTDSAPSAESSPVAATEQREFTLVEHADIVTFLDLGAPGASPGDTTVWGPNPLYDESNSVDSGATTQGHCLYFDNFNHCLRHETVVFENGDMLQIHGTWDASSNASGGIIVGGSGQYLGATGMMSARATEDRSAWARTFAISV